MPNLAERSHFIAGKQSAAPVLAKIASFLPDNGFDDPRRDARHLLGAAIQQNEAVMPHEDIDLDHESIDRLLLLIARRAAGEPISRIKGKREFYGLEFSIDPSTLDPRADSEVIVDTVIDYASERPEQALTAVDFGTGSGCLILSAAYHIPQLQGVGVDIQAQAANMATQNAQSLGLESRISFITSDWDQELDTTFDIVISNPPYIPQAELSSLMIEVKDYDPMQALDGGDDGLVAWRQLAAAVSRRLSEGGIAVFEIGQGQESDVAALMKSQGLSLIEQRCDLSGIIRCLVFAKNQAKIEA